MELQPTLDVFASREAHVLPRYTTLDQFDGGAVAINGLSASWQDEIVWLHPPLNLILKALTKTAEVGARGVIIVPSWKGQQWSSLLTRLSCGQLNLGPYATTTIRTRSMIARGWRLPPGNLEVHFLAMRMMTVNCSSTTLPSSEDSR
jgi:hypothetical protein